MRLVDVRPSTTTFINQVNSIFTMKKLALIALTMMMVCISAGATTINDFIDLIKQHKGATVQEIPSVMIPKDKGFKQVDMIEIPSVDDNSKAAITEAYNAIQRDDETTVIKDDNTNTMMQIIGDDLVILIIEFEKEDDGTSASIARVVCDKSIKDNEGMIKILKQ